MSMPARKLKGAWYADFRFGRRRYRWRSPEDSRKGAEAYERYLTRRLVSGDDIRKLAIKQKADQQAIPTFQKFAQGWLESYVRTNNKPSTRRAKVMIMSKHLIPYFGKLPLTEITSVKVEQFKAEKNRTRLSPKTINNILSVLSMCIRSAEEWGYVERTIRVGWLKVPPQTFDLLTEDEVEQLLNPNIGEPWYTLILMALRTGMRHGELCGLNWKDVDLPERRITVQQSLVEGVLGSPKSNQIRHIPISEDLADALESLEKRQGFVFTMKNGKPLTAMYTWRGLRQVCRQLGMRVVRWHALRHTFASHLVTKGVPIRTVQILMGHSTVQMTERYSHLAPSALHEAVGLLDRPRFKIENFRHPAGTNVKTLS